MKNTYFQVYLTMFAKIRHYILFLFMTLKCGCVNNHNLVHHTFTKHFTQGTSFEYTKGETLLIRI